MHDTALIMTAAPQESAMISQLAATGLFETITPLSSASALFNSLEEGKTSLVCWHVQKMDNRPTWISRLQAHEHWNDMPLIAFAEDQQSLLRGFHLGASDAVHVEIDPFELSARLNRHLQRWQRLLELLHSQEQLQHMALTDPLTQLGNRATFDLSIKQAAARQQRSGAPYSLLIIDLDHLKKINDTYGHQTGDYILQQTAAVLRASSRNADICCRNGGDEFAIVLPDTQVAQAEIVATRIHRQISLMECQKHIAVSVSIGISSSNQINNGVPEQLTNEADCALYQAKQKGRNLTEIWRAGVSRPAFPTFPSRTQQLSF